MLELSAPQRTHLIPDLFTALLGELEIAPKARRVARAIANHVPASAVVVYVVEGEEPATWIVKAVEGDVAREGAAVDLEAGILGLAAQQRTALHFRGDDLLRHQYRHLDVRQRLLALSCFPVFHGQQLLGCIEVLSYQEEPSPEALHEIEQIADGVGAAFVAGRLYEAERNAGLAAVSRMVQLYDIEKIFSATLEMQALLPVICDKVQELMQAGAVNVWLVDGNDLLLARQIGDAAERRPGERIGGGNSLVERVSEDGEPRLQESEAVPADEKTAAHSQRPWSTMAAPLIHEESLVGVLEVMRRDSGNGYSEEDLFTLAEVAGSAAQALHNSSLLQAERKIEILQMLVAVSQEITSTLDRQQVLKAVVDQPARIFSYERAAIALAERGTFRIKAVSGKEKVDGSSPEMAPLQDILQWAGSLDVEVQVSQRDGEISDPRPETRAKFLRYFEQTGSRGFYALPLADEESRLGVLSFESPDPDFLTSLHIEAIKVLAGQVTVALRNATLYREVPFIGLIEPMMEKRRRLFAIQKRRRLFLAMSLALFVLLLLVPIPMRVSGEALVAPISAAEVTVQIAVPQRDVLLLRTGDPVRIKLESFPLDVLHGRVSRIGAAAQLVGDDRMFFASVNVPNPRGQIRSGMQGFGKIRVSLRPLSYVLLRTPALWLWSRLWSWFSW